MRFTPTAVVPLARLTRPAPSLNTDAVPAVLHARNGPPVGLISYAFRTGGTLCLPSTKKSRVA